jgi:DNA invertase Pin-like site-specific DNA recombinase
MFVTWKSVMKVGYARTSTVDQEAGLQDQIARLEAVGCEKIFEEKLSSVIVSRPKLEAAIEFVREGDVVVITKLDRLARSVLDLWKLIERLQKKDTGLLILDFGGNTIDTRTAAGRAMLNMFATMAQFEREVMLERQRIGIAKAKAEGKFRGRKPTARAKSAEVLALKARDIGASEIAKEVGISRKSVYRIIAAARAAAWHSCGEHE